VKRYENPIFTTVICRSLRSRRVFMETFYLLVLNPSFTYLFFLFNVFAFSGLINIAITGRSDLTDLLPPMSAFYSVIILVSLFLFILFSCDLPRKKYDRWFKQLFYADTELLYFLLSFFVDGK